MSQELVKPWRDLEGYKRLRLLEAKYEAELAAKFLEQGLIRNAAGKAFQAWKALMAALLADKRDELLKLYPGEKKLRKGRGKVAFADWLIAVVPTSYMEELSLLLLGEEVNLYTEKALAIHEYQYNGPDREGVLSPFRNDEIAKANVLMLLKEINKVLRSLGVS
ncbi:MAG: PaREP1 family protein [Thermoprotei archaeon]